MIFAQVLLFSFVGILIAALIHRLFEQSREIRDLKRQTRDLKLDISNINWEMSLIQGQLDSFRMVMLGEFPASDLRTSAESESNLNGRRA